MREKHERLKELCEQARREQDASKIKMLMDQILKLLFEIQEDSTKVK